MEYVPNIYLKEEDKSSELSEVEISNLPHEVFRIMIVKMIQNLGKIMQVWIEKI